MGDGLGAGIGALDQTFHGMREGGGRPGAGKKEIPNRTGVERTEGSSSRYGRKLSERVRQEFRLAGIKRKMGGEG